MALTQISTAGVKDDAVTAGKIPANAVGSSELADNAVTSAKIASGGVQASNINSNAVSTGALQSNAVNTNKIADDAVTAAKLASNAVVNASVDASAAIAGTKISPDFGSQNIVTTGETTASDVFLSDAILHTGDTNTKIRFPAADTVSVETAGSERLRVDSSGRLGLGVTPTDFHSNNTAVFQLKDGNSIFSRTGGQFLGIFQNLKYNSSDVTQYVANGLGSAYFQAAGVHKFYTASSGTANNNATLSEIMRIDSSGRVLMGSTSSTASDSVLQVRQDSSGANFEVIRSYNDANTPARVRFANSRGTAASPAVVANGDDLGELRFTGHDGTDYNNTAASIIAAVDGGAAANDMPGRLEFLTTADGANTPTERMRIDASGNVNIGVTSPQYAKKVNIQGPNGPTLTLSNQDDTTFAAGTHSGIEGRVNCGGGNWAASGLRFKKSNGTSGDKHTTLELFITDGYQNQTGLIVNEDGEITKPKQPMANVGLSSSTQTSTGVIMFNYVRINQGSIYNTANGRFTAPVAGKYFINIFGMSDSDNTMDIQLEVNGSVQNALAPYNSGTGGQHNQISASAIINLSANDYMHFKLNNGSFYAGTTGRHGGASCFLIG